MINEHWSAAYLKQPILSILPLKGGKQHQIELLTLADQSLWVCKTLSRSTWLGHTSELNLIAAENLAAKAAAELGISFAAKRGEDNNPILGGKGIIIPYCEGRLLASPSPNQSFLLGKLLAKLHLLNLSIEGAKPLPLINFPENTLLPAWLKTLVVNCNLNCQNDIDQMILSHRDIHMANIIWRSNEKPHLIDWESAGLIHPGLELVGLALNCAGLGQGLLNKACFRATLSGYSQQTGKLPTLGSHFAWLNLHSWLLWYVFCLNNGWKEDAEQTLQSIVLIQAKTHEIEAIYTHHENN